MDPTPNLDSEAEVLFPKVELHSSLGFWATTSLKSADAERSFVTQVDHYKCRSGKQHEFLLIHVQHPSSRVAQLCLDRSPKPSGHASSGNTFFMVSSSRLPAHDRIFVPADGTEWNVTQEFGHCRRLRTLTFPTRKPSLIEFAILLLVAVEDDYQLYHRSCYWFAGLMWEVLKLLYPHKVINSKRSTFHHATYWCIGVPQNYDTQAVIDRYQDKLQTFIEDHRRRQDAVSFHSLTCFSLF
jgi:hypothetical protein